MFSRFHLLIWEILENFDHPSRGLNFLLFKDFHRTFTLWWSPYNNRALLNSCPLPHFVVFLKACVDSFTVGWAHAFTHPRAKRWKNNITADIFRIVDWVVDENCTCDLLDSLLVLPFEIHLSHGRKSHSSLGLRHDFLISVVILCCTTVSLSRGSP